MSKIEGVVPDQGPYSADTLAGNSEDFYPNFDTLDPYPLRDRGYYFTGVSVMQVPPSTLSTTPLLTFSNEFTIIVWVLHMTEGAILSKQ